MFQAQKTCILVYLPASISPWREYSVWIGNWDPFGLWNLSEYRSSHRRCSIRKGVLRNFAKFTRKHLCQSLFFNKVAGLRLATLLKNKLWHRFFLRTSFLQNTPRRLLLRVVYAKNKQVKLFLILNRKLSTAGNVFTKPLHYRCRRSPSELS